MKGRSSTIKPYYCSNAHTKARDSTPCSSHPQKLQAHEPLHAVLTHEHRLQSTAAEPEQSAAASMPSQWTSELPSMRTTSPHTHQISLELEVPICQTSPPPMAQTHCLQAPLPRTSGSSPTHATSPRTQDSDLLLEVLCLCGVLGTHVRHAPPSPQHGSV